MIAGLCLLVLGMSAARVAGAQAADGQKPAQTPARVPAQTPTPSNSNPFPEDTSTVPLMPSTADALAAQGSGDAGSALPVELPANDLDPMRSPDDTANADDVGGGQGFSSSSSGLSSLLPDPNAPDQPTKHGRHQAAEPPPHQETAEEDITVGKYYMDNKNWRAALSRFQSAMVLAPENPDVYWGLAESQRHLGKMAEARANYQLVVDYDPDSRHGKDAMKALKTPEIANAKAQPVATPAK
jgi:tetratricopeptide (TPR) repeat protein